MKKISIVGAALLLAISLTLSVFAGSYKTVVWESERTSAVLKGGDYPRMEMLGDGTLLICHAESLSRSTDGGLTWTTTKPFPYAATYTADTGTVHALTRANHQPFVLRGKGENGKDLVMVAYRCHTKNFSATTLGEFYTSLRLAISTDGGVTFGEEQILIEATCNRRTSDSQTVAEACSFRGFWEPMLIQLDTNTVALYYADDLNVTPAYSAYRQQIRYLLYDIPSGTWSAVPYVAIDGETRTNSRLGSRDGMPSVTRLSDGSFAMVIEAHDYNARTYIAQDGTETDKGYAVFVISLARSEDGKTWDNENVIPILAPTDTMTAGSLADGHTCAAPYITTLPDGRVVISYQTNEGYTGTSVSNTARKSNLRIAISNEPLTYNSKIEYTTGGLSADFTLLSDPFDRNESGYQIWNSVGFYGGYLYAMSYTGINAADGSATSTAVRVRRAKLLRTDPDLNGDGVSTLADVICALKMLAAGKEIPDYNNDGSGTLADVLCWLTDLVNDR